MESRDLSADISFERLPPASSVPPVSDHASKKDKDADRKSRRRRVPTENEKEIADSASESSDDPEHQIDNLA